MSSRTPHWLRSGSPWLEGILIALAALPVLLLMDAYVRDSVTPKNDELIYELMAQSPFEPHTFPFAHRIAVPTLVHVLPFEHGFSFSALAWLFTALCGTLTYVLLRRFDIGKNVSAGLAFSIALCPILFVSSIRQGRYVDPESVFVMLAGTIAIVDRRLLAFGAIVLVGSFVREAALFLIPFAYAVWAERLWDPKAARQTLAAAGPAIVAYTTLRLTVPSVGKEQVIGYDSLLGGRVEVVKEALERPTLPLRRMAYAFGPLWLVAPFALRDLQFARRGLVLVATCVVGLTFALDWGRVIFLALPVIVVAAGWVLKDRPRLAAATIAAFLALDLGYVIYMEELGGAQGIIDAAPSSFEAR